MIIWSGLGFVVALIGAVCLMAMDALTGALFNDANYFATHGWPKLVALAAAGGLTFLFARFLDKRPVKRRHSLFFIPVKYWAPLLVVLGGVLMFVKVA